jgi:hypothetical protein
MHFWNKVANIVYCIFIQMLYSVRFSLLVGLFLTTATAVAQPIASFSPWRSAKVGTASQDSLPLGFAGGWNSIQFGRLDFDDDGQQDLIGFDRDGYRWIPLQRRANSYTYRGDWVPNFPAVREWMVFADYNCDGLPDLFCGANPGIGVYQAIRDSNTVRFQWALNGPFILTDNGTGTLSNLYVSIADRPVVDDVDNDGDLDILTFGLAGFGIEWHKNTQPCGLQFVLETDCWGDALESKPLSNALVIDACTGSWAAPEQTLHSGSALAVLDLDANGKKDVLLGDMSYPTAVAGFNVGTALLANIESQDTAWPSNHTRVNVPFPCPSTVDANNDGQTDVVVGTNLISGPYLKNTWLYSNTGTPQSPVWTLQDSSFLQRDQLDFGKHAVPCFADWNTDGQPDLLVGTEGKLRFYRNAGTVAQPWWKTDLPITLVPAVQTAFGTGDLAPTAGDLDGDGDLDLVVGRWDGTLVLCTNSGGFFAPSFQTAVSTWLNVDVGQDATPELFDVDQDGDLDLLVGNFEGNLTFIQNTGSLQSPAWDVPVLRWGGISADLSGTFAGKAVPRGFVDAQGAVRLVVGTADSGVVEFSGLPHVLGQPTNVSLQVGTGTLSGNGYLQTPFGGTRRAGRHQYLIRKSELGTGRYRFTHLGFEVLPGTMQYLSQGFTVRMGSTPLDSLTGFVSNLKEVFDYLHVPSVGPNSIALQTPFDWDGSGNVVVEICFSKNLPFTDVHLASSTTPFRSHAYGDAVTFNALTTQGCTLPLLGRDFLRPNFKLIGSPALERMGIWVQSGRNNAPAVRDFNGDGYPELALGNRSGGLLLFRGEAFRIGLSEETPPTALELRIWPNPAQAEFWFSGTPGPYQVVTLTGQVMSSGHTDGSPHAVQTSNWPAGMYVLRCGQKAARLMVVP